MGYLHPRVLTQELEHFVVKVSESVTTLMAQRVISQFLFIYSFFTIQPYTFYLNCL